MIKPRLTLATLAALVFSASLVSGAAAQDEAEPMPVDTPEGVTWLLQQQAVDGAAALEHLPKLVLASLVMEGGQAYGDSGCNTWFAPYELDGESLTFGLIGTTMMACPGPAMAVERAFLANLAEVASWFSDGGSLTLSDAQGNALMLFEPAPDATVVGSWVAQGINNGSGGVETNEHTPSVTAVFDEEGQLSGSDGCNDYFTSYELDGDSIAIAPEIATTLMACAEPALGELSQQYFAALIAASTWAVDASGALELRDAEGALQVRYEPAP